MCAFIYIYIYIRTHIVYCIVIHTKVLRNMKLHNVYHVMYVYAVIVEERGVQAGYIAGHLESEHTSGGLKLCI